MRPYDVFPIWIRVVSDRVRRTVGHFVGKAEPGIETSDQPAAISPGRTTRYAGAIEAGSATSGYARSLIGTAGTR